MAFLLTVCSFVITVMLGTLGGCGCSRTVAEQLQKHGPLRLMVQKLDRCGETLTARLTGEFRSRHKPSEAREELLAAHDIPR